MSLAIKLATNGIISSKVVNCYDSFEIVSCFVTSCTIWHTWSLHEVESRISTESDETAKNNCIICVIVKRSGYPVGTRLYTFSPIAYVAAKCTGLLVFLLNSEHKYWQNFEKLGRLCTYMYIIIYGAYCKYWKSTHMQNTEKWENLYWKVREQFGGTEL